MNRDNKAILVGSYGGDRTHALAAWSSTYLELGLEIPDNIEDRVDCIVDNILSKNKRMRNIEGLLSYLAKCGHTSPFEFSFLHFNITEDYKSHIHSIKHRIGHSKNSESTRYKERVEDKFYLPEDWKGIESSSVFDIGGGRTVFWYEALKQHTEIGNRLYHKAVEELSIELGRTRAKESAAYFLSLNNQVNVNDGWDFGSFMRFQKLRNSTEAQKEIREIAEQMLEEVRNIEGKPFEYSLKAFNL